MPHLGSVLLRQVLKPFSLGLQLLHLLDLLHVHTLEPLGLLLHLLELGLHQREVLAPDLDFGFRV
jgi:hypothetical protein